MMDIEGGNIMKALMQIRKKVGLTQCELAERLNVGQSTIAMWETGCALPTADKLPQIAETLHCSIDELFGRTER